MTAQRNYLITTVMGVILYVLNALAAAGAVQEPAPADSLSVTDLTVEHRQQPLGIDTPEPRIGWIVEANYNGARQTAYEIRVSSNRDNRGDVWSSGRVESGDSFDIVYTGPKLQSRTRYHIAARVWDEDRASEWSTLTWFETAFIDSQEFQGEWIGRVRTRGDSESPEALLRSEFDLPDKQISVARAYIAGLGYYKAYLNGSRIGDHELDPAFTPFDRRVMYVTYDITDMLRPGSNAIGVSLGRGFYADYNNIDTAVAPWLSEPKLKLHLLVRFDDGTEREILSDASWKASDGPTLTNSVKYGEVYDARLQQPGWNDVDFDDRDWARALLAIAPSGALKAQDIEPVRVTGELSSPSRIPVTSTTTLYDFKTTRAGWARIRLSGPAGSSVTIKYGEKLTSEGTINSGNDGPFGGTPVQVYSYTLRGDPEGEIYTPSYSYNGYRFVQVDAPEEVRIEQVEGLLLNNDIPVTGVFESSDELLNRYHRAMVQSTVSNLHHIPTDTPMYEKRGWAADALLIVDSALMNLASENFWEKWMLDHRDNQAADGGLAVIVPNQNPGGPQEDPFVGLTSDPIWSSSYVLVNHALYRQRGNLRTLRENYAGMTRWMAKWMRELASTDYLFTGKTWGDHEPAYGSGMDNQLVGTAYIYRSASALAEIADALGNHDDAGIYSDFARRVGRAINTKYYDPRARHYDFPYQPPQMGPPPGVELPEQMPDDIPMMVQLPAAEVDARQFQTDNVLPLALGLVPAADRAELCKQLLTDVGETHGEHITTGATVLKDVMPTLSECGGGELAYRAATTPSFPGWGYWFLTLDGSEAKGGETIIVDTHWEAWHEHARSHNHAFRGTIDDWLFQYLAGIRETSPGYRTIRIAPQPVADISYARAAIKTPLGKVSSDWKIRDGQLDLEVIVPVGAVAEIHVPAHSAEAVKASAGAQWLRQSGSRAVYQVGSGVYRFHVSEYAGTVAVTGNT
ncbi:Bacterial alpha-L-rhamnosidase [Parahaliea maris]|uniref:alpha-L-rhamnosidase n=1 Tax=Parahaliea maris TaxID=2716870 RepID=A0A5C8ZRT0_9GAMM|nr:family 78 glycoside hydrolase catalytic domain [Parahaliea maris]TXS90282.1 Bacterial alpha-L-rhamnosidase [Parahaliea maris]